MKIISVSKRLSKLTAVLLSAILLVTASGINLLCKAAAPGIYYGFTGDKGMLRAWGCNISTATVDNVSPDGTALAYTPLDNEAAFILTASYDSESDFRKLTPAQLKGMEAFVTWISAPACNVSVGIQPFGEKSSFNGRYSTYNTTTGELNEYYGTGTYQQNFEGYVIFDLRTASFSTDWGNTYPYSWSDVVDMKTENGKNNFDGTVYYNHPNTKGNRIIFDSIGVSDSYEGFIEYQKSRPLKTAAPTANYNSGTVKEGTQIKLSTVTKGAEIYYTLDGTDPSSSPTRVKYALDKDGNSPIVITDITTVRAVAVNSGRYSTVSIFNYNVLSPDTPNTTVVNDGSDIGKKWNDTNQSRITVVDGMGPKGKAYCAEGIKSSGAQMLSFKFDDSIRKMDKSLLGIHETFSFWVSTMDGSKQNFDLCFNAEGTGFYGDVATYNTITGEIKEYNNVRGVDLSNFEGYVIYKLQGSKISTGWGAKSLTWGEYISANSLNGFLSYRNNALFTGRKILFDELAFSISYDKLIEELKAQPLRTAPPAADQPDGALAYETQIKLTSSTEGAEIYYTLDGTDPLTSDTAILYTPIFMAAGLYDSPIRISKAWDDLGIKPDSNGNYTVKAYAVAKNSAGEDVYSAVQTFTYSLEPIYDGEKDIVLNNGDGTGRNKITWYNDTMIDAESGAEYTRGDSGKPDLGMKFTEKASNKAHLVWMGLDTSKCVDSTGYNQFHNIQAISYRIQISGLSAGTVYRGGLVMQKEGCEIDCTTYVVSDDQKVYKNAAGSLGNGSYTVVMLIDDSTTVSGWAVTTQKFRQYVKNNSVTSVGFYISPQEYEKDMLPTVIYDDFTAHFDSKELFERLDIDGLLKDYDSGTYENSAMLVCNDGSGAKLNGGLSEIGEGIKLAESNRSKDERCLSVTLGDKKSFVSFGNFCTDPDAILCDGIAFWAEVPKGTGAVTLDFKMSDSEGGETEHFKYADTKWHYQIDSDGGAARVYGKITLEDGFRGWIIIPGDNFHYISGEGSFVNGAVDYDKLSEFTVILDGSSSLNGKTIYLDDISIFASLEAIIKAHAGVWKTKIR